MIVVNIFLTANLKYGKNKYGFEHSYDDIDDLRVNDNKLVLVRSGIEIEYDMKRVINIIVERKL